MILKYEKIWKVHTNTRNTNVSWACWCTTVIPAPWETEAGRSHGQAWPGQLSDSKIKGLGDVA